MNLLFYSLVALSVFGLFIPAYGQNISQDDVDIKIREEIAKCVAEVDADESLTDAEKTVAKRTCATEITNRYKDVKNDHRDLAEKKARLNNIQQCIDWHPQFRYLTEQQFRIQKNSLVVNDCIRLYKDSIWEYHGPDRLEKLLIRIDEIKKDTIDIESVPYLTDITSLQQSEVVKMEDNQDQIDVLEAKIKTLEEQLIVKDLIIKEQLKVIMDLANRLKNIIYEPINIFISQI